MQLALTQAKLYIKKTTKMDKNVHKGAQGLNIYMHVCVFIYT